MLTCRNRTALPPLTIDKYPAAVYIGDKFARVAELVDARDLKSLEVDLHVGSTPTPGTKEWNSPQPAAIY